MNTNITRRKLILTGLAALATNTLAIPLTYAHMRPQLSHKHSSLPTNGHRKFTIMLDPGHGGIDSGAVGCEGSLEKHVVLDITFKIKAILNSHGINALQTRSDDTFIPLYDRVQIAHAHKADLFMSIHG